MGKTATFLYLIGESIENLAHPWDKTDDCVYTQRFPLETKYWTETMSTQFAAEQVHTNTVKWKRGATRPPHERTYKPTIKDENVLPTEGSTHTTRTSNATIEMLPTAAALHTPLKKKSQTHDECWGKHLF